MARGAWGCLRVRVLSVLMGSLQGYGVLRDFATGTIRSASQLTKGKHIRNVTSPSQHKYERLDVSTFKKSSQHFNAQPSLHMHVIGILFIYAERDIQQC